MVDVISEAGFWPFWLRLPDPGHQPPDGIFSGTLLLETRLESKSFETLAF